MRNWLVFFVCLSFLAACGGSEDKRAEKPEKEKKSKKQTKALSSGGKKWGGWRWKGRGDDCFFLVDQRCYQSKKKACRAAKCDRKKKRCLHDDRAPAMVYCQGDPKPEPGTKSKEEKAKRKAKSKSKKKDEDEDEEEEE